MALVGGNLQLGSATTGPSGYLYLGNYSMSPLGGSFLSFDRAPILALEPVATGGSITVGAIDTGNVQAAAGGSLTTGAISARGLVALSSRGALQTQNITAGRSISLIAGGAVGVGNLTIARSTSGQAARTIDGPLSIAAIGSPIEIFGASITAGNIITDNYVGLYTPGTLATGSVGAGGDVIALVGGNANLGAITTPGRFILGGYSMLGGLGTGNAFNPSLVFGLNRAMTGGSAIFGGASNVRSFEAYVGGPVTLQSLTTSGSALINASGLFTLNGVLNGNSRIISNDIDIGTGGAVNSGNLELISRNATQTVVGDGVSGGGYALSDAEFDRIHTSLSVIADVSYGAAARMLIGDLSATVSGSSRTGYDYLFATLNGSSSTSVGSVKVVGDVTFTGLSLTDEVAFRSNTIEVDAATGSINLFGQGTTLGGVLALYAPRVWVASGDILARLETDPRYSGYIAELNAPAAVQRPEGVIRAASIEIDAGAEPIQSLLVQNSGTRALPAGFLLTDLNISSDDAPDAAAGSVDLAINGQVITQAGTATGAAVRDGLVEEFGTAAFTGTSTINGCPLTGSCNAAPLQVNILRPTDFQLVNNGGLGDGLFGNELDIDDGQDGDSGDLSSPISPPVPLFDSRPLNPDDDVNDPASGAGNPSLYGSPVGDDDEEEKKARKIKKGTGK